MGDSVPLGHRADTHIHSLKVADSLIEQHQIESSCGSLIKVIKMEDNASEKSYISVKSYMTDYM